MTTRIRSTISRSSKGAFAASIYRQVVARTNLVLIEPDLAEVLRDAESVNLALRLLIDTAEAAPGPAGRRRGTANRRLQPPRQGSARR